MVRVSDSGPGGPGFNTRKSQTQFCIFDGCHDYSTHDTSDLKKTIKCLMVGCKNTNKNNVGSFTAQRRDADKSDKCEDCKTHFNFDKNTSEKSRAQAEGGGGGSLAPQILILSFKTRDSKSRNILWAQS